MSSTKPRKSTEGDTPRSSASASSAARSAPSPPTHRRHPDAGPWDAAQVRIAISVRFSGSRRCSTSTACSRAIDAASTSGTPLWITVLATPTCAATKSEMEISALTRRETSRPTARATTPDPRGAAKCRVLTIGTRRRAPIAPTTSASVMCVTMTSASGIDRSDRSASRRSLPGIHVAPAASSRDGKTRGSPPITVTLSLAAAISPEVST